jgi:Tol biopolymer transport system component
MKRCPQCFRDYADETLLYCLDDGSRLVEGPGLSEPQTAILPNQAAADAHTAPVIHTTSLDRGETNTTSFHPKTSRRFAAVPILILLPTALLGLGIAAWYLWPQPQTAAKLPAQMKVTRLTSHGQVGLPAISPDGKYVIYTLWESGKGSLWLRQASSTSAVQLVPATTEDIGWGGRTFSRDGEKIYYVSTDKDNERGVLYELPVLGGVPRKIISDISSGIAFAPDGRSFVFRREDLDEGASSLIIHHLDSGAERALATRKATDWFVGDPAWSPDGRSILCGIGTDTGGTRQTVGIYDAQTGSGKEATEFQWRGGLTQFAWLGDGSGFLVAGSADVGSVPQIWQVSYPTGSARQLTNDLNGYNYVSITADGSAFVTRQEDITTRIWTYSPGEDPSKARQITNGKFDGSFGANWMPDGRIIYTARTAENVDIWTMNADGTVAKQLNSDSSVELGPCATPDGRFILFVSDRNGGVPHVFRMAADGTGVKQLTSGGSADDSLLCSPDSRWALFGNYSTGPHTIWKVPTEGDAEATQLTAKALYGCSFKPDSSGLVCGFTDEESTPPRRRMAELAFPGGELVRVSDIPPRARGFGLAPDGKSLIYSLTTEGFDDLWSVSLAGGQSKQVTNLKQDPLLDQIAGFVWSADGKKLAIIRAHTATDVVLMKDFR